MSRWEFPSTITASMHFDRVNCWKKEQSRCSTITFTEKQFRSNL